MRDVCISRTGLLPSLAARSRAFCYTQICTHLVYRKLALYPCNTTYTTVCPLSQASKVNRETNQSARQHVMWFRLFPLRSPLLRESLEISFPLGTEMFHFPRSSSYTYVFSIRYAAYSGVGFPIRISSDQSLLGNSPRLFAPCNVLHRHLVSRHPPFALNEIAHYKSTQWCYRGVIFTLVAIVFELSKFNPVQPYSVISNKVRNLYFYRLLASSGIFSTKKPLLMRPTIHRYWFTAWNTPWGIEKCATLI